MSSSNSSYNNSGAVSSMTPAEGTPETDEFDPITNWDELGLPPKETSTGVWEHVYENGRRYHLYKHGRYPIPNDDLEQNREEIKHALMLEITDGELFQAPIGDNPEKIIDIGTGTGRWAIEVGDKFPNAQVLGIDLSPIQPEWIPENVRFMVDDCEADWMNGSGWTFAHFRQMAGILVEIDKVIAQTFEHLKPGGWVEFQELSTIPLCDDGTMPEDDPLKRFYELAHEALERLGMQPDKARALRRPLTRAGFEGVRLIKKKVPIGPWARDKTLRLAGMYLKSAILDVVPALTGGPFQELGMSRLEREVWAAKVRQCLEDTSVHRYFYFYFWYAQKPES